MTDDLEVLLRDHYRRAAEDLHPGPGLIHRAQAAGARHRRRRLWPFAVAAATAAVILAVPLLMVAAGPGTPARPAGGLTRPAQRERPIVLRLDQAVVPAGTTVRLTGEAGVPLGVYLRIAGHWQHAGEVTPTGGHFAGQVVVPRGTSAIRVCSPVPAHCSAAVGLVVPAPEATPATPRPFPQHTGPRPPITPRPHPPAQGTPAMPTPAGSWPVASPRPGR